MASNKPLQWRIDSLTHEVSAHKRYAHVLEKIMRSNNIALPHDEHPVAGLAHVIHYVEGSWPTHYEIDMAGKSQQLIVGKNFGQLSASIINNKGHTVHPSAISGFDNAATFKFELLCREMNSDTYEPIRVPTTGRAVGLKELVQFEHNSTIDIETGYFTVTDAVWTLKFRPLVSSGCNRRTPRLFKIRISPLLTDAYKTTHSPLEIRALENQLTVETEPFRTILRKYDSNALKSYRKQHFNTSKVNEQAEECIDVCSVAESDDSYVCTYHPSSHTMLTYSDAPSGSSLQLPNPNKRTKYALMEDSDDE